MPCPTGRVNAYQVHRPLGRSLDALGADVIVTRATLIELSTDPWTSAKLVVGRKECADVATRTGDSELPKDREPYRHLLDSRRKSHSD